MCEVRLQIQQAGEVLWNDDEENGEVGGRRKT
jgi:hypothetical protein